MKVKEIQANYLFNFRNYEDDDDDDEEEEEEHDDIFSEYEEELIKQFTTYIYTCISKLSSNEYNEIYILGSKCSLIPTF